MAKGTIIEHQAEGLYRIRLSYSRDQLNAELERIEGRLPELAAEITQTKNEISDKESGNDEIVAKINALIPQYVQDRDEHRDELISLQRSLADAQAFISKLKVDLAELESEQVSLRKRRQLIDSVPEDKEMDAWCADYTTDLEGDVGIADINDEGGQGVVIEPGFEGAAAYNPSIHGQLMAREAMSGPQVYFNAAILPGMQKWFPRYRAGTITQIEGDTCSVKLERAESSAQGLDINEKATLSEVPIQYMDCNAEAFEEDDPVLVRFTQSGPLVVGFLSEPRECDAGDFAFIPAQYDEESLTTFGLPMIPDDPLGTPGGENPAWFYRQDRSGDWDFRQYRPPSYGPQYWESSGGLVISWRGGPGRLQTSSTPSPSAFARFTRSSELYCNGRQVADVGELVSGGAIYGAAIKDNALTVIALSGLMWAVIQYPWKGRATSGPGAVVDSFPRETDYVVGSGWHFNENGDQAVLTIRQDQEKVAKRKYILGGGIQPTEVLWERDYEGVGNLTSTPIDETHNRDTYHRLWVEHDIPVYVDYIGNQEVTLYLRHRQRETLTTLNTETDVYTHSDYQEAIDLVLSTGKTLATIGPTYNQSINHTSDEYASPPTMSWNETVNVRYAPAESMYVDIRKGVVAFDVIEDEFDKSHSGSSDDDGYVSGSSISTGRRVYEMHVDGSLALSFTMQEYMSQQTKTLYQSVPDALGGQSGDLLGPESPVWRNGKFVDVGHVEAKGQSLSTMLVRWPESLSVDSQEEVASDSRITDYPDPQGQLFGGRPDMTLYAIGRL